MPIDVTVTVTDRAGHVASRLVAVATAPLGLTHGVQLGLDKTGLTVSGPDLSLVGATARGAVLTTVNGNLTVNTANAVISGKRITGQLIVRAAGVVVRDCAIEQGVDCRLGGGTYYAPRFEFCTIGLHGGASDNAQHIAIYHGVYDAYRCLLQGFSDGARICGPGSATLTECFIRVWADGAAAHCDGIQDPCGYQGNLTVQRCYVDAIDGSSFHAGTNAAITRADDWNEGGNPGWTLIDSNFLASQNKAFHLVKMDMQGSSARATITNNILGTIGGAILDRTGTSTSRITWTNNRRANGTVVTLP